MLEASERADRTGEPFAIEYRHVKKDGSVIWVHEEAVAIERDGQAGPSLAQGVMYDVTERKHAEQRSARGGGHATARSSSTSRRSRTCGIPTSAARRPRLHQPADRTSSSATPAEEWSADPQLWASRLHPEDRERVLSRMGDVPTARRPYVREYRMRRARRHAWCWLRDEAVPVRRDDDGHPFCQGVMFDITERKAAEERLAEAEARYRTLVEQLPVVVYQDAIDDVSTALYISPQYERLFGFPPGARLRDPQFWVDHLHPEDRDRVLELSKWTNETGEPFSAEYRFIGRDGRVVWVRDEAELLRDADGRPMMWQGVLLDVTARKHAEEALSRRDVVLEATGSRPSAS